MTAPRRASALIPVSGPFFEAVRRLLDASPARRRVEVQIAARTATATSASFVSARLAAPSMHATGYRRSRPGFVIDHLAALASGGADLPCNMQWQTKEAAMLKDKTERAGVAERTRFAQGLPAIRAPWMGASVASAHAQPRSQRLDR